MDRKKGDVKYQTTQTGETGKAELFRIYLAECRGPFGLFLLFCCIFACVFYLYRLPAEAVLYATALCIFPTAAVLMAGYRKFRRKYRTAERIRKEFLTDPDSFYLDELPQAKSAMELEYHRLIFMLFEDRKRMSSRFEESKGDMTDYYTINQVFFLPRKPPINSRLFNI